MYDGKNSHPNFSSIRNQLNDYNSNDYKSFYPNYYYYRQYFSEAKNEADFINKISIRHWLSTSCNLGFYSNKILPNITDFW